MEARKEVALEAPLDVPGRRLTPVVATYVRSHGHVTGMAVIVHEAIGIIVWDDRGVQVLMVDGRELTLEQLVAEYPDLDIATAGLP